MTVSKKNYNKIKQNKAQYNLDRQTAKNSALSSINLDKYEFLTEKDVLPEKNLIEKAAEIKRFEYSPFGNELKKQTSIAGKQYQELYKVYKHDKKIVIKKTEIKSGLLQF